MPRYLAIIFVILQKYLTNNILKVSIIILLSIIVSDIILDINTEKFTDDLNARNVINIS